MSVVTVNALRMDLNGLYASVSIKILCIHARSCAHVHARNSINEKFANSSNFP